MKYIACDVHPRNIFVVVLDEDGKCLHEKQYPTSAEDMIGMVEMFSDPKLIILEETDIAAWLVRILRERDYDVVVADPVENAWIARDENIDDMDAARKLAELARAGLINPVHHPERKRQELKQVVMHYHECSEEAARAKNKLNSHFCRQGIYPVDRDAYRPTEENPWLVKLDDGFPRWKAEMLLERVQALQQQKQTVYERMMAQAGQHDEVIRFMDVPGMGPVRSATFFAIIDTPQRFSKRSKMCSYCGVGISRKLSDQTIGAAHLTWKCNRRLKDAVMGAARSAITSGNNKYAQKFLNRVAAGKEAHKARADVARSIVGTLRAMWIRGEEYDDNR